MNRVNNEKNILIVGEKTLPITVQGCHLYYCPDPSRINVYSHNRVFYFFSKNGWKVIDLVLWRCQFDKDLLSEQRILEVILQSDVKCINNVRSCLTYGHTAIMNHAIYELGLPALMKTIIFGEDAPYMINVDHMSKVMKVGEFHGGFGKVLINHEDGFIDILDLAVKLNESISFEKYIPYTKDVRALFIDGHVSLYERVPSNWKANVSPKDVKKIVDSDVPDFVIEGTLSLASKTQVSILGVDWLLSRDGNWYILEGNMAPGVDDPTDLTILSHLIEKKLEV